MRSIAAVAVSGMQATSLRLAIDASNIANVNSNGFIPSRVLQSGQPGGGTSVQIAPDPAARGDLTFPIVDQLGARYAFAANAVVLRVQFETLGRLLDVRA